MEKLRDLTTAAGIAREAGDLLLSYFQTDRVAARSKGHRDVVTAADEASERLVVRRLSESFPQDGVVGEEGSSQESKTGRRWFVDPLDGTLNYAHGIPIWCVSLALFQGSRPVLGVVHDPIRDETFCGVAGDGARCGQKPIRTSGVESPADAMLHLTVDFHDESLLLGVEDLEALAPSVLRTRNTGSAALALAYVAAGRFDAMAHRLANAWDYGAGIVLVEAAGGVVSDLAGEPYTDETQSVLVAGTSELHRRLLEMIPVVPGT